MATQVKLTPAQRESLRRALELDAADVPEWQGGRVNTFGHTGGFARRLVEAGVAEYRYVHNEAQRGVLTEEIDRLVADARTIIGVDWHTARALLERAEGFERTRDEQALYVTDAGRAAVGDNRNRGHDLS
jgi:hypothetical protein